MSGDDTLILDFGPHKDGKAKLRVFIKRSDLVPIPHREDDDRRWEQVARTAPLSDDERRWCEEAVEFAKRHWSV